MPKKRDRRSRSRSSSTRKRTPRARKHSSSSHSSEDSSPEKKTTGSKDLPVKPRVSQKPIPSASPDRRRTGDEPLSTKRPAEKPKSGEKTRKRSGSDERTRPAVVSKKRTISSPKGKQRHASVSPRRGSAKTKNDADGTRGSSPGRHANKVSTTRRRSSPSDSAKPWKKTISSRTDAINILHKDYYEMEEDKTLKLQKVSRDQFGKNNAGESYDYNLHIRICLNAAKIKKAGLPKANALPISKLCNESLTAGLHMDWARRNNDRVKKKKYVCLFDREDLRQFIDENGAKAETSKNLSDRWKKLTDREKKEAREESSRPAKEYKHEQRVVLDKQSLRKASDLLDNKVGSYSIKSRVGAADDKEERSVTVTGRVRNKSPKQTTDPRREQNSDRSPTIEQRVAIDPKWVPRTGRYFLHDDREDNDYFGGHTDREERRISERGGRTRGGRGSDRGGWGAARRARSPQVWSHDKFGDEDDEDGDEIQNHYLQSRKNHADSDDEPATFKPIVDNLSSERVRARLGNRRSSPPNRTRSAPGRNNRGKFIGQRPFYEQLEGESAMNRNNRTAARSRSRSRRNWRNRSRSNPRRSRSNGHKTNHRSPERRRQSDIKAKKSRSRDKSRSKSHDRTDKLSNVKSAKTIVPETELVAKPQPPDVMETIESLEKLEDGNE